MLTAIHDSKITKNRDDAVCDLFFVKTGKLEKQFLRFCRLFFALLFSGFLLCVVLHIFSCRLFLGPVRNLLLWRWLVFFSRKKKIVYFITEQYEREREDYCIITDYTVIQ